VALLYAPLIQPGEAWVPWLHRVAEAYQCSLHSVHRDLHLVDPSGWADVGNYLSAVEQERLAALTGLPADVIAGAHLESFHGTALAPRATTLALPRVAAVRSGWALWSGARVCPKCLLEPSAFIRNRDRLGLSVVCSRHGVLLADRCPRCTQRPFGGSHKGSPPGLHARMSWRYCHGKIQGRAGSALLCGFDLADAPCPQATPAERASDDLLTLLLTGHSAFGVPTTQVVSAWRALTALFLPAGSTRPWLATPSIVPIRVAAIADAASVLAMTDHEAAAGQLQRTCHERAISLTPETRHRVGRSELAQQIVALARRQNKEGRVVRTKSARADDSRERSAAAPARIRDPSAPVRTLAAPRPHSPPPNQPRPPGRPPRPRAADEVLHALYDSGATHRDIARELGVSASLALVWLKGAGVQLRPRGGSRGSAPPTGRTKRTPAAM
jgi:hypothetical protein